jgi:DNA polymerase-1
VTKCLENTLKSARKKGYVETLFGRKRYLPEINSSIVMLAKSAERMAVNMPFQGTVADMIKMAMIKIEDMIRDKEDIKMLLQVHDELVFEIKKEKAEYYTKKIKDIMESIVDLKVPVIVDVGIGNNWGELK